MHYHLNLSEIRKNEEENRYELINHFEYRNSRMQGNIQAKIVLSFDEKGTEIMNETEKEKYAFDIFLRDLKMHNILECTSKTIKTIEKIKEKEQFIFQEGTLDERGYTFTLKDSQVAFYLTLRGNERIYSIYENAFILLSKNKEMEKLIEKAKEFLYKKSKHRVRLLYKKD